MAYKIKNVTNLLDKRHPFANTSVDIEYVQRTGKESIKLKVGEELIFDSDDLPISVHNLRIKKFIRVTKLSEDQVAGLVNPPEPTQTAEADIKQLEDEVTYKTFKKKK